MKRIELLFNLVSIPLDALTFVIAGVVSFYIRYQFPTLLGPVQFELSLSKFLLLLLKVIPILLLIFTAFGLYNLSGTRRFWNELTRVVLGISMGMLTGIVLFFFNQSIFPSRFIILATWILSILLVIIGRLLLKRIQRALFLRGYGLHRLAIVNGQGTESQIITQILRDKSYGYQIVAELDYNEHILSKLDTLINSAEIDEIVQTNQHLTPAQNLELAMFTRNKGLQFSFTPNLFEVQRNVIELNNLKGVPIISLKNTPLDGWGKVIKRLMDIILSAIGLIITAPLMAIITLAIKLDSSGSVIYKTVRCGKRRNFMFYKFRTMHAYLSIGEFYGGPGAEQYLNSLLKNTANNRNGPLHKIKDDPRVTRQGRFLRRLKLDELPQFWNVLRGDMSMVGPRPHLPEQVERYQNSNARLFSIKPGVFGLTQIAQITWPTLPFDEEIRLDTYYIENWSIWLDFSILIQSFILLIFRKKNTEDY